MFLSGKNQYFENDYTAKCNLQIQCNPYQIANGIFHRTRTKKNLKISMETHKKNMNRQNNLGEKRKTNWSWRKLPDFRLY